MNLAKHIIEHEILGIGRGGVGGTAVGGRLKIALFGDSYAWYENSNSSGNSSMDGSLWHKALALVGYHRFGIVDYLGVGGNTSLQMSARISDVLQSSADVVLCNCGANDFYGLGYLADDVFVTVTDMIAKIINTGKIVIWANSPTQAITRTNWTLARQKECLKYNRMLNAWAADKPNVHIADLARAITDMSDQTNASALSTALVSDGIHLSRQGALLFGRMVCPALDRVTPKATRRYDPLDSTGEAASNNVMPAGRGQMTGTGGTAGTSVTAGGNGIPLGWTGRRATGTISTGVVNKVTEDNEGVWTELVITAGSNIVTAEQFELFTASFHGNLAAHVGKRAKLVIEIKADSQGTLAITNLNPRLYTYDGTTIKSSDWSRNAAGHVACAYKNDSFIIETPLLEVRAGLTAVQVYCYVAVIGTGAATVKIRNAAVVVEE